MLADPSSSTAPHVGLPTPASARTREDHRLFTRMAEGDRAARDELVGRFIPLARSLARRFEHSGEPLEDLVQVASLALVKAIDRFDPARGNAFTSFAVPTIVGELKRHFRDRTWSVRPPRDLQELIQRIDRISSRLAQEIDRMPTVAELSDATGVGEERILEALEARNGRGGVSLQAPLSRGEDGASIEETLGADDDAYALAEMRSLLDALCVGLPDRSRDVLRMRFAQDMTQSEIGARLGVSQMQVSRILRQSIARMREVAEHQQRLTAAA